MRTATRNTQLNLDTGISSKIQCDVKRKTIKQNVTKKKKKTLYNVRLQNTYQHTFTTPTPDSIPALTAAQFTPGAGL